MSRARKEYEFPKGLKRERREGVDNCCEFCGKKTSLEVHHICGAWLSSQNDVLTPAIIKTLENQLALCPQCHKVANECQHGWDAHEIALVAWALFDLNPEEVEQAQRHTYKDLDSGSYRKERKPSGRSGKRKRRRR